MDEKESPVASCSYATNGLEIGATGSSNSTSVSAVSAPDESDTQNPNEELLEDVEIVKKEAETSMERMRGIIDSSCKSVISRWRDAEKSVKETLKLAEKRIREANDEDLKFQSQHVAQIFANACSSARSKSNLVAAEIDVAEAAYGYIRKTKDKLEKHAIQHGMVGIGKTLNELKKAIIYDSEAGRTLNCIANALEEMKKCYEDIDKPEFLHERFIGRDPRIASGKKFRKEIKEIDEELAKLDEIMQNN